MTKYIVAFDQGTSSCRAILVNSVGQQISKEQKEFTQIFPQAGWVEHNPLEIWEVMIDVFDKLLVKNDITPFQIEAIGITNQRETTVVWNKHTGKPIYNAIVWQDKRTSDYCKELKKEDLESYTRSNMGLPIDPYFSATKLRWILNNTEEKDLLFGTIDTWLIWNMTKGKSHKTDYTNASRTLLYNIKTMSWDNTILSKLAIPKEILPEVQSSCSQFGMFEYQGHKIPITGVAGDQQAALVGQSCFDKGMAKNTYGTGCFMLMNIGKEFKESNHGLITTLCCDRNGQATYAFEGSIFMAGASIQWLRDGLRLIKDSSETEELSFDVKESDQVIVVPSFAGLGAPYWSADAKGAIFGLTRDTTKAHIAKATLEGIAFRTKDIIDAMERDSEVKLKQLKVDGGGSKNNYLLEFQSNILNIKIERPINIETTAMGVAYLAGLESSFYNKIDSKEIDKSFSPSFSKKKIDRLYANWKRAVKATLSL